MNMGKIPGKIPAIEQGRWFHSGHRLEG